QHHFAAPIPGPKNEPRYVIAGDLGVRQPTVTTLRPTLGRSVRSADRILVVDGSNARSWRPDGSAVSASTDRRTAGLRARVELGASPRAKRLLRVRFGRLFEQWPHRRTDLAHEVDDPIVDVRRRQKRLEHDLQELLVLVVAAVDLDGVAEVVDAVTPP